MTRNVRRALAVLSIAAATVLTVQADTAGAGVSCSLRVVDRTADSMTLRYEPHDNTARTVWVDGHPTTIAPHTTAVVRRVDSIRYPTADDVIDVAELVALCGDSSTTTTSSTTTVTTPFTAPSTTTSTSALTTITVVRVTPEPTTPTAPLPPATWIVVGPTTTTELRTTATLPETGPASIGDIVTVGLLLPVIGVVIALAVRRRKDGRS